MRLIIILLALVGYIYGFCEKSMAYTIEIEEFLKIESAESRMNLIDRIDDQCLLANIALNDRLNFVREKAINNINDNKILYTLFTLNYKPNSKSEDLCVFKLSEELTHYLTDKTAKSNFQRKIKFLSLNKITDDDLLFSIVNSEEEPIFKHNALKKIKKQGLLIDIAMNHELEKIRSSAVQQLEDTGILEEIISYDSSFFIKETAKKRVEALINRISDQKTLIDIAKNDQLENLRVYAVEKIEDTGILEEILLGENSQELKITAIKHFSNLDILHEIVKHDSNSNVVEAAEKRANDLMFLKTEGSLSSNIKKKSEILRTICDQEFLLDYALHSKSESLAAEAAKLIKNQDSLNRIFKTTKNPALKVEMFEFITPDALLYERYYTANNISFKLDNISKLRNLPSLLKGYKTELHNNLLIQGIKECKDIKLLERILLIEEKYDYSHCALKSIGSRLDKKTSRKIRNTQVRKEAKKYLKEIKKR